MYRALVLSLTLLLVSLFSIRAGMKVQPEQVLSDDKNQPIPEISAPVADNSSEESEQSEESPRFVLTPPKGNYSSLEPSSSEENTASGSVSAESQAAGSVVAIEGEHPFVSESAPSSSSLPMDPSADAKNSSGGERADSTPPKVATQDEITSAAEPFIKEIFMVKSTAFERMDSIEQEFSQKLAEAPLEERASVLYKEGLLYLPEINALIETADTEVEKALNQLKAALTAIGAGNDSIIADTTQAYEAEKSEKINYYTELFSNLSSSYSEDEGSGI